MGDTDAPAHAPRDAPAGVEAGVEARARDGAEAGVEARAQSLVNADDRVARQAAGRAEAEPLAEPPVASPADLDAVSATDSGALSAAGLGAASPADPPAGPAVGSPTDSPAQALLDPGGGAPTDPTADDRPARAATMFDVAKVAGVSHQTVSRVLNNLPGVRESTRERVARAMATLQYIPSPAARTLASRRSQTIGLITAGRPDYGPANAALGFNEAARAAHYTVTQAGMRELDADSLRAAAQMMVRHNVEAIVLISGERSAIEIVRRIELPVPVVTVDSEVVEGIHRVAIDQYEGARLAMEHLIGLGHSSIAHVAGPADAMDATERIRAWRDALAAHGLPAGEPILGDWQSESGYRAGRALLADGTPSAIFVANDQMALGVLHALKDAGLRVPADVSVVGFDDIPEAAHFDPPLTTVRQDFEGLGRDIMARVLDVLDDENRPATAPARIPELVVRASTAAPRP